MLFMKKGIALLLVLFALCLSGCVESEPAPQTDATQPAVTVPKDPQVPENVVTPGELPSNPQDGAEVPQQPQPTIITE